MRVLPVGTGIARRRRAKRLSRAWTSSLLSGLFRCGASAGSREHPEPLVREVAVEPQRVGDSEGDASARNSCNPRTRGSGCRLNYDRGAENPMEKNEAPSPRPRLKSVGIRGFRSIRTLDLELGAMNVLIGANGAGKSNLTAFFSLINEMMGRRLQKYVGATGVQRPTCTSDRKSRASWRRRCRSRWKTERIRIRCVLAMRPATPSSLMTRTYRPTKMGTRSREPRLSGRATRRPSFVKQPRRAMSPPGFSATTWTAFACFIFTTQARRREYETTAT